MPGSAVHARNGDRITAEVSAFALECRAVGDMEERRLTIDNLRTRLELLDAERRALLRELASSETPLYHRTEVVMRRAELQQAREDCLRALRNLGERVEDN